MIGVFLVTHGEFAKGIIDSMEMICGPQEKVMFRSLRISDDVEDFAEEVENSVKELDDGSGVLVLTDLMGGSPSNVVCRFLLQETKVECIAGLNFPMLIEAVSSREFLGLKELAQACVESGITGIVDVKEKMLDCVDDQEDD